MAIASAGPSLEGVATASHVAGESRAVDAAAIDLVLGGGGVGCVVELEPH